MELIIQIELYFEKAIMIIQKIILFAEHDKCLNNFLKEKDDFIMINMEEKDRRFINKLVFLTVIVYIVTILLEYIGINEDIQELLNFLCLILSPIIAIRIFIFAWELE